MPEICTYDVAGSSVYVGCGPDDGSDCAAARDSIDECNSLSACNWIGSEPDGFCSGCSWVSGPVLNSAYVVNGDNGAGVWVNHEYHGERLATGNVYDGVEGDEVVVATSNSFCSFLVAERQVGCYGIAVLDKATGATIAVTGDFSYPIVDIELADITGDGVNEIIVALQYDVFVFTVSESVPDVRLEGPRPYLEQLFRISGFSQLADIAVGDVTGDRTLDIVAVNQGGLNTLHVFTPVLSEGWYAVELAQAFVDGQAVEIGDIDGDGVNEIVAGVYGEEATGSCEYTGACDGLAQEACEATNTCYWDGAYSACYNDYSCDYSDESSCENYYDIRVFEGPSPDVCDWVADPTAIYGYGVAAFHYEAMPLTRDAIIGQLVTEWFVSTDNPVVDVVLGTVGNGRVAAVTEGGEMETVYLLKGDGSIVYLKPYVGNNPSSLSITSGYPREIEQLAIGDVDGDGANDLIVANQQAGGAVALDVRMRPSLASGGLVYAFKADGSPIWRYIGDSSGIPDLRVVSTGGVVYDVAYQPGSRNVLAAIGNTVYAFGYAPRCGDGIVQSGEECDGANLNGKSCSAFGYASGSLACTASCTLDTSACSSGGGRRGGGGGGCFGDYELVDGRCVLKQATGGTGPVFVADNTGGNGGGNETFGNEGGGLGGDLAGGVGDGASGDATSDNLLTGQVTGDGTGKTPWAWLIGLGVFLLVLVGLFFLFRKKN